MHVCMYVCLTSDRVRLATTALAVRKLMYTCMYACMHAHVRMYARMYVRMYESRIMALQTYTISVCVHVRAYDYGASNLHYIFRVNACTYTFTYKHLFVCLSICTHTRYVHV
jgi:hypothetical protein